MAEYPVPAETAKIDTIRKQLQQYRAVVRMICTEDSEMRIHRVIKHWLGVGYLNKFVGMHTNVWAGNGVYRVDVGKTQASRAVDKSHNIEKFVNAIERFPGAQWNALITRYQKFDIFVLPGEERVSRLADILRTLLHIDGRFVHFDLHMGNAGVMRDGTTVIHDFGRAVIRDYLQVNTDYHVSYPDKANRRVYRNQLIDLFRRLYTNPTYSDGFDQFEYIAKYLVEKMNTIAKDQYTAERDFEDWLNVSCYNEKDPISGKIVERDPRFLPATAVKGVPLYRYEQKLSLIKATNTEPVVSSKDSNGEHKLYYMKPVYETRYHQLARIHDVLAVLAGFTQGAGKTEAEEAAQKLLDMVDATIPSATRENVEKVVNECLVKAHDAIETRWDPYTKEQEVEMATAYWKWKSDRDDKARMKTGWWTAINKLKPAPTEAPPAPKNVDLMKPPMTREQVIAEDKIPAPQIPADASVDVKEAIEGILSASSKPNEEVDDGLGPWTIVDKSGKHNGGTFRRRRLPRLL